MGDRDSRPAVDSSVLDNMCEGDRGLREELVRLYLEESKHQLRVAKDAVSDADHEELRLAAYNMWQSAKTTGAPTLADVCRQLQRAAGRGNAEEASALLAAVSAEFERVKEAHSRPPNTPS